MKYKGRSLHAHRMAWELTHGPIPDGLFVCHRCDNPPCCNPDHLFLGTPADNVHDAQEKGRRSRRRRPRASADVERARQRKAEGMCARCSAPRVNASFCEAHRIQTNAESAERTKKQRRPMKTWDRSAASAKTWAIRRAKAAAGVAPLRPRVTYPRVACGCGKTFGTNIYARHAKMCGQARVAAD